jgi:hypothetical protein
MVTQQLQQQYEMDALSKSRRTKGNAAAKVFQLNGQLQSSKVNQRLKAIDGESSEAVKVDQAAWALTAMGNVTSRVSPIRHSTFDLGNGTHETETTCPEEPSGAKRCSTQDGTMVCKRQRRVRTKKIELVDDRAAEACIPCPVCLLGLAFLPLDIDLREPVRNPALVKSMRDHSTRFHPDEPLWNALLNQNSECFNIQKILNMHCDFKAAMALVDQSLAIAARALDVPKHKEWASSWSRVQALTLARIGSAHCYATNIKLCQEAKREKAIKREARRYLAALISSAAETPPPEWWDESSTDSRRRNCVQVFFLGNHRLVGFIKDDLLPKTPTSGSMEPGVSSYVSATMGPHLHIWQPPECVWTDPFYLDSECLDAQKIMNMNCDGKSVLALVTQCLAIAARSLPRPKRKEWACSWSRVKALTLARLGSAHRSATNAKVSCLKAKKVTREKAIISAAQHYLAALVSAVEATPSLHKWRVNMTELITISLFEDFFLDGAKHREIGFIHPEFLPEGFPDILL